MQIIYDCECGQRIGAPASAAGRRAKCPKCGRIAQVPAPDVPAPDAAPGPAQASGAVAAEGGELVGRACVVCRTPIAHGDDACTCSECQSAYHRECWDEIGGCATYGCELMPKSPKPEDEAGEHQAGWGDEKACPRCRKSIRSVALKCRFCKARFPSPVPMTSAEYGAWKISSERVSQAKTTAVVLFAFSVLGFLAPILIVVAGIWVWRSRKILRKTGGPHEVLAYGSVILSVFYSIILYVTLMAS